MTNARETATRRPLSSYVNSAAYEQLAEMARTTKLTKTALLEKAIGMLYVDYKENNHIVKFEE